MYAIHILLVNFRAEFRRNVMQTSWRLVGFHRLEYENFLYKSENPIEAGNFNSRLGRKRSGLIPLEDEFPQKTILKGNQGNLCARMFFTRPWNLWSMTFSSLKMEDTQPLHGMVERGTCSLSCTLMF